MPHTDTQSVLVILQQARSALCDAWVRADQDTPECIAAVNGWHAIDDVISDLLDCPRATR